MESEDNVRVMGPPIGIETKIGKQLFIEAIGNQTYVDWPKDGSFETLHEIMSLLMVAQQAIINTMAQQTMLEQRSFQGKPAFSPKRN